MLDLKTSIKETLREQFDRHLETQLSILDDYLKYEPNLIIVQNAINQKKYSLLGYIDCLDNLDVFPDKELDEMFELVEDRIYPKQKMLEALVKAKR
jgi:hypothetical protein